MHAQAAYDELIRRTREESLLSSCAELLGWDEETYMPRGGVEHRGSQMALLAGLGHERATHPRMGELLHELESSGLIADPLSSAAVNVRELRRKYDRLTRLPRKLIEEIARVTSLAQQEWEIAFERSEFALFQPWLEKVIDLKRHETEAVGYEDTPYDALLAEYEPGARSHDVAELFAALRQELIPLTGKLTSSGRRSNASLLQRDYPLDRQRTFGEMMASSIGFDFLRGRLDLSTHPFSSTIGPGDCRITTRFSPRNFADGFFSILHEVGHALYEQGLDPDHHGTPFGAAPSVGMHESQARLWENTVGRSRAFWQHFLPLARRIFHEALRGMKLDEFHFAINQVEPSLNRVRADEVTYNLHILIRFELERALIDGNLRVADLPAAWNESYRHYLGVVPSNDAEGCLQDGHWAAGLIGYFPTYTLGNIFAAQLFARVGGEVGDLQAQFSKGDFSELLGWLREKVYREGSRRSAVQLIEHVTASAPDPRFLVNSLHRKYSDLYRLG